MKTAYRLFFTLLAATLFTTGNVSAQDDTYYDPTKDPAKQNTSTTNENSNTGTDYTDGYGNATDNNAYKYDPRDSYNSNKNYNDYTATDGGYYDEDDYDSYTYTTRLYRYYRPNYGVNFYSYWFTPSYYYGFNNWNSWNSYVVVSYRPWYYNNFCGWGRPRHNTVIVYDPYYDPYWSYSWGWNSCNYYNNYNYYGYNGCYNNYNNCGWSSWGYNGWGYNNGGFCGGYYNGYNNGYWNGYNNGYYAGWNSAYGYGNGYGSWYNPYYHHRNGTDHSQPNNPPVTNNYPTVAKGNTTVARPATPVTEVEIPREGIQRPINTGKPANLPTNGGVSVKTNSSTPYDSKGGNVVVASPDGLLNTANNGNAVKGNTKPTEMNKGNNNGTYTQPKANPWAFDNANDAGGQKSNPQNTRPFVKEPQQPVQKKNDWSSEPPANWGVPSLGNENRKPNSNWQSNDIRQEPQPVQPKSNWNEQPNYGNRDYNPTPQREMNNNAPSKQQWIEQKNNQQPVEQPRNVYRDQPVQQQRPVEQPRNFNPQPRNEMKNFDQPRNIQQTQPRQIEQRSNGGGAGSAPRGKKW